MSEENLKVVITGDASGLDIASAKALEALNKIAASAAALDSKLSGIGGGGSGIVSAVESVTELETSLENLGKTASRISVVMPSVMADRGETITVGAKAVDQLNESLTTTASTLSKIDSEWDSFAQAPFVSLAAQAEAFDAKARRLNQTINYTDRSMRDLGSSADAFSGQAASASESTEKFTATLGILGREKNTLKNLIASRDIANTKIGIEVLNEQIAQTQQRIQALQGASAVGSTALARIDRSSASATNSLFALSGIVQDAPYGFRAIANNITFFTQQMAYSAKASGGFGAALKGMASAFTGPAGIIFAISAGVSLLDTFLSSTKKTAPEVNALADRIKSLRDAILDSADAEQKAKDNTGKQEASLRLLYSAATDITRSMEERINAATKLQTLFPKTFGNISQENIIAGKAATAYKDLAENILKAAQAEANFQTIIANDQTISKAQKDADKLQPSIDKATAAVKKAKAAWDDYNKALKGGGATALVGAGAGGGLSKTLLSNLDKAQKALKEVTDQQSQYNKVISDTTAENDKLAKSTNTTDITIKQLGGGSGGTGGKLKTVAEVMADLATKEAGADALGKILHLTIEQIGALKLKALSDAINNLAHIATPEAIKQGEKLSKVYDDLGKKTFLSTLTGGRTNVTAGKITKPGVPTTAIGQPNLNTDSAKVEAEKQKALNDQLRQQVQIGGELDSIFGDIFTNMANGGDALQGLIQAIEQLIIKLAAAAAAAAVLNALTGGGAAGFGAVFGQLSGLAGFIPSHAQGGYIPGPQLAIVGDAPGGEWVLNQRQISAILNGTSSGREVHITGTLVGEGSSIKATIDTVGRKQGRRG